jgi:hypothetical protein
VTGVQTGALPICFSREVRNFLNYRFPGRWIGRGGPHNWPASSPDISPLDNCVWENWFTVWRWEREMHCLVAFWMRQIETEAFSGSCNTQLAQFKTERQPVLRPAVAFSKTSFKHRSVQIKGTFMKLTLHLYFKCIMYYAGLLSSSVYCQ